MGLSTHTHGQPNDSHGDTEQPTDAPTPGAPSSPTLVGLYDPIGKQEICASAYMQERIYGGLSHLGSEKNQHLGLPAIFDSGPKTVAAYSML